MFKVNKLWTYFTACSSISIVNFKHVIANWDYISLRTRIWRVWWGLGFQLQIPKGKHYIPVLNVLTVISESNWTMQSFPAPNCQRGTDSGQSMYKSTADLEQVIDCWKINFCVIIRNCKELKSKNYRQGFEVFINNKLKIRKQ